MARWRDTVDYSVVEREDAVPLILKYGREQRPVLVHRLERPWDEDYRVRMHARRLARPVIGSGRVRRDRVGLSRGCGEESNRERRSGEDGGESESAHGLAFLLAANPYVRGILSYFGVTYRRVAIPCCKLEKTCTPLVNPGPYGMPDQSPTDRPALIPIIWTGGASGA